MDKEHLTKFLNYIEGFTQRIMAHFPDSRDFISDEKTVIITRFLELASVQPTTRPSQISVIDYMMISSLNRERQKSYSGVEDEIKRTTPEECVDSLKERTRFGEINL